MNNEKQEFCERCEKLDMHFVILSLMEPSNRVWIGVMSQQIINRIMTETDPKGALEQVIELLNKLYEDKQDGEG